MDRQIVYPGQIPLETDLLHAQKDTLIGLAMACQAVLGTATVVDGLACAPTNPASLSVTIGSGSLYAVEPVDASAYGSLPADTTDSIVKQGIQLAPTTLTLTPPGTVGYAINYLIEAAYLYQDGGSTVLPYYNASNPSQAYSGPNNSGAAQNTVRQGLVSFQAKAGVAAGAGSQLTPAVDAGYTALYVVTVAYGATTITAGNITPVAGAPFITPKLPQVPAAIQAQTGNYAPDTGVANAYVVTLSPAPAALTPGLPVRVKIANTNTGPSTLTVNGLPAAAVKRPGGAAAQAGDLMAGQVVELVYDGASFQFPAVVATAGASSTVAGSFKALAGKFLTATTAIWTADELVVETALGGTPYKLANYSQTLNLAATGAGGLDTGAAPASGWLYIYAIYNPTTATASILGTTAGTGATIYPGANLPAGYTASVLIGALYLTASAQFALFAQQGTTVQIGEVTVLSSGSAASYTSVSLATAVPPNAKFWSGVCSIAGGTSLYLAAESTGTVGFTNLGISSSGSFGTAIPNIIIITPQVTYYKFVGGAGAQTFWVNSYTF